MDVFLPADEQWTHYARELGVKISQARQRAGLSQEHLANAAGISTFTYRKLEKGESNPGTPANPRLRTLVALAAVLNVPLASLLPAYIPDVSIGRLPRPSSGTSLGHVHE